CCSAPWRGVLTGPVYWCPGGKSLLNGWPTWISGGGSLWMLSRSVAQIATASMRRSTSACLGTGTGFCVSASSPGLPSTHAFMRSGIGKSLVVFTLAGAYIADSLRTHAPLGRGTLSDCLTGVCPFRRAVSTPDNARACLRRSRRLRALLRAGRRAELERQCAGRRHHL